MSKVTYASEACNMLQSYSRLKYWCSQAKHPMGDQYQIQVSIRARARQGITVHGKNPLLPRNHNQETAAWADMESTIFLIILSLNPIPLPQSIQCKQTVLNAPLTPKAFNIAKWIVPSAVTRTLMLQGSFQSPFSLVIRKWHRRWSRTQQTSSATARGGREAGRQERDLT